ncbi:MAG: TetR/AcrR family transcriptional regulator [Bacteroidetes bacterium]|nr:TetR/AcrR family transcriptional regulator [Bacteroidota bacterium]
MPPKVKFSRESVVNSAFKVVRKQGWQGLTARSIANELNSSTNPIYSHLKSMKDLEEEVIKKAIELFEEYIKTPRTGDKWIDHAFGYLLFAKHEKYLFKAIHDENHSMIYKKHSDKLWEVTGEELSDYHLFKDLPEDTVFKIRHSRWVYIHGLASLFTNSFRFDAVKTDEDLFDMIRNASMAIFRGIKDDPNPSGIYS